MVDSTERNVVDAILQLECVFDVIFSRQSKFGQDQADWFAGSLSLALRPTM